MRALLLTDVLIMAGAVGCWGEAFGRYFTAMRGANRSPGTIKLHRHYLTALSKAHPDPWKVDLGDLSAMLARPSWGAESKKSARTVYRGFYRWAHGMGYVETDPALALPAVTVPPGVPRPTPELEARRLFSAEDARLSLMARLAGMLGLRAAEIAVVHSGDLDGDVLRVHGKGGKTRIVYVVDADLLADLQAVDGWAFPGRVDGHLSPGTVSRYLSRAMAEGWTGHTLRHRAGTRAYEGTMDLLAVGKMLGHARTETTQRYVRIADAALRKAMKAAAA